MAYSSASPDQTSKDIDKGSLPYDNVSAECHLFLFSEQLEASSIYPRPSQGNDLFARLYENNV